MPPPIEGRQSVTRHGSHEDIKSDLIRVPEIKKKLRNVQVHSQSWLGVRDIKDLQTRVRAGGID